MSGLPYPPQNLGCAISIFAAPSVTHIVARTASNWWNYTPTSSTGSNQSNTVLPAAYTEFT
jgi:hypothetical protein